MNNERHEFHMSIGAVTIFMIFVVLVMCVLSILSYLRAKSYDESMMRQLTITSAYYQSEAKLMNCYYQLDVENIEQQLSEMKKDYVYQDGCYILEEKMDDDRVLKLIFQVNHEKLEIISLKTENKEKNNGS